MKSSATWTVTVAAAALLALPGVAAAQTPPTTPPTQSPTPPTADAAHTPAAAQDHLRQAKATLGDIGTANLTARSRTQIAELKKRMATLERMAAAGNTGAVGVTQTPSPTNTKTRVSRATANWGNEVAAMDKIVTTLLGVSPTGTSGTTSTKPSGAVTLDDATRTKLTEFRTHLTAFATAMSTQTQTAGDTPTTEPSAPTPATEPPAAQPAAQKPAPATPAATEPAAPAAQKPDAPGSQKVDEETAKRHLTEARNTLSQMTQLPAAAKLTGDVRTQITQLISNFNELITTQSNWSAAYAKVSANLTALLGPDTGTAPSSGTEGAVGTSGGGMTLDPALRDKLLEMRKNLTSFERASGGGAAAAATPDAPASAPTQPAEPTSPPTEPTSPTTGGSAPAATDALTHVAAIEALLKSHNESGGMTLDKAQVELLRTHIAELRKLLEKK